MPSFKSFSPRFSLTYDISGDGKNVLKFSAARYGSRVGTSIAYPMLPTREIDIYWYGDNGDGIPTYDELAYYGYDYLRLRLLHAPTSTTRPATPTPVSPTATTRRCWTK